MKRLICLLLVLALFLSGCASLHIPFGINDDWEPYAGSSRNYTCFYSSGRNLEWEEDILFFADSYLEVYPLLTHFPSRIEMVTDVEYTDEFYDPQLRQTFIDEINALIPRVWHMTDTEILYELQRLLAMLHDAHTYLLLDIDRFFPISFQVFWEEEVPVFRVSLIPSDHEDAMFCALTGINGIPVEEVIRRLSPYISYENEPCLLDSLSGSGDVGALATLDLLRITGVVKHNRAVYNLVTPDGTPMDVELRAVGDFGLLLTDLVSHTHADAYPEIYGDYADNFFHRWMEGTDIMYARVNEFDYMADYTFMDFGNEILALTRDNGGVEKLIIDLRQNPGGYQFYGYPEFINALNRIEYESLYVLIDEGSYSSSIIMAGRIKNSFPEAILAGTPAGQPPNFFASMNDIDYVLPNSGITCRMPMAFWRVMPDYEYDALMPDLPVYPTLEDYRNGVDTILEAVIAH